LHNNNSGNYKRFGEDEALAHVHAACCQLCADAVPGNWSQ